VTGRDGDDSGRSGDAPGDGDGDADGGDGDPDPASRVFAATVREGVCRLRRSGTRWLSTGFSGGVSRGPAAYVATVPEGWPETDLDAYARARRVRADFPAAGPTLLTGVDVRHARRARAGPVEAVATAGVSNPAALPVPGGPGTADAAADGPVHAGGEDGDDGGGRPRPDDCVGTVNVVVGTTRSLPPGALANLVAVAAEAKAAALLARAGVPGTTTDAVVAACDPAGERARFSGSATPVGAAARACVRDAVLASLDARYAATGESVPTSVHRAEHGVVTDVETAVSRVLDP
jgi:adenosylcobinamide hydrolase